MADHIVKLQGFHPGSLEFGARKVPIKGLNDSVYIISIVYITSVSLAVIIACFAILNNQSEHFSCCVLHWVLDLCHYHSSSCVCTKGNGICCKCTTITCSLP